MQSKVRRGMRYIALALLLSACTAYPRIDWPTGVQPTKAPHLLPQAELLAGTTAPDTAPDLVSRAAALRAWAASLTP